MMKGPRYVIAVPDLPASAEFYGTVLGFKVHEIGDPGWRFLVRDRVFIMAGECPDALPPGDLGDHSWFAYIEVDDIERFYEIVRAKGAEVISPLTDEPWGMREFGVRTIDGHRIRFGGQIQEESVQSDGTEAAKPLTWYMRPVFFVADVQRAIDFYVGQLGFEKKWHEAGGKGTVCQVDRGGCEIILCENAAREDRGRLFLELSREGVDQLLREVDERSIPTRKTWWGYDVLQIIDPDGNDLLVCLENLLPERA